MMINQGLRDDSVGKSTGCCSRGPSTHMAGNNITNHNSSFRGCKAFRWPLGIACTWHTSINGCGLGIGYFSSCHKRMPGEAPWWHFYVPFLRVFSSFWVVFPLISPNSYSVYTSQFLYYSLLFNFLLPGTCSCYSFPQFFSFRTGDLTQSFEHTIQVLCILSCIMTSLILS